jgi:acyl carrier protein
VTADTSTQTTAPAPVSDAAPVDPGEAEILATVAQILEEVIGDDALFDLTVSMETRFNEDLELESIEFVALSVALEEHYGDRVDFVAWLSEMELRELIDLSVGDLVRHIASNLA